MENHFLCYPHTSNHTVHKNGFLEKLLVKTEKDKYLISNFKMKQEQKKLTPHKIVGTNRPSDESTPTNFPKKNKPRRSERAASAGKCIVHAMYVAAVLFVNQATWVNLPLQMGDSAIHAAVPIHLK